MTTSDYDCLTTMMPLRNKPTRRDPKEFYYSRLINQPKDMVDLETYLEYIIRLQELIITKPDDRREKFQQLGTSLND